MQPTLWTWILAVSLLLLLWGVCGLLGSHVAGLRGDDRLDGFKTGVLFGPVGVGFLTFKKASIPDIEVECPSCGMRQDVGGDLDWFECWQCEERAKVPRRREPS